MINHSHGKGESAPRASGEIGAGAESASPGPVPGQKPLPRQDPPPRHKLDAEEQQVMDLVLRMGGLVERQIRGAAQALVEHDADRASAVIARDQEVNEAARQATELVVVTIATQQPVARDLRYLLTFDHLALEIERIGDHAANMAKYARRLAPGPELEGYLDLPAMAELAASGLCAALDALLAIDVVGARQVAAGDDEIDRLHHRTFARVLALMQADPANVDRGAALLVAAHELERVGDRVTNIAEDIVYLTTGQVEDLNP
jgi:phosphate transport system protein